MIFLDISADLARLLGLALNRIGGTWDEQLLGRPIVELEAKPDIDLAQSGFTDDELRGYVRRMEAREKRGPEHFDLDAALVAATREPRTKLGDLWKLGEHPDLLLAEGLARAPNRRARIEAAARLQGLRLIGDSRAASAVLSNLYGLTRSFGAEEVDTSTGRSVTTAVGESMSNPQPL